MARQFDLCRLGANRSLVIVLQDDALDWLDTRVVAPLQPTARTGQMPRRISPPVSYDGQQYAILMQSMAAVPTKALSPPLLRLPHLREDIIRALDLLFTGV